jgi:basic membrane protein A
MKWLAAVFMVLALFVAACAEEDEPTSDGDGGTEQTDNSDFLACQVTDTGGVDDKSFNQTAFKGMQDAQDELGIAEPKVLESQSPNDFEPNIQAFIQQGCDIIVTVGFLLGEATEAAAQANPDQNFAIVDFAYDDDYDNLRELIFSTEEAAFLAGYVAAGMSESGIIGTFGGIPIPPVTVFMDGFLAGASYYNDEHGTDVVVEGWDGGDGLFTGNFESQDDGRNVTDSLLQAGADIVMPVAGPVGLGTATAIEDFGQGMMIWVDTDGYESTAYGSLMLTSVMKNMDVAVFDTVAAAVNDQFEGGLYIGTLENDGVGIAPFHDFEGEVPAEIQDRIPELTEGIINGEISVDPADY